MDKDIYTEKQKALLRLWQKNELKRITLLEGSVRSGKTWISLVLWAFWVATAPKDGRYLMAAKTLTSLRRNCLDVLEELVGTANFTYSLPKKEGCLFGRKIYLEGANDARAENKIRGMTLSGAYCDELTLFAEDFFAMLLTRLSAPGAKLIATTNPDSPFHWLKEKYIDRAADGKIDMLTMKFLIDENTFLDADHSQHSAKQLYTGLQRGLYAGNKRCIFGQQRGQNGCCIGRAIGHVGFIPNRTPRQTGCGCAPRCAYGRCTNLRTAANSAA